MAKRDYPPLLPLGFHEMDIVRLEGLCVTAFSNSKTRTDIMAGLKAVIDRLSSASIQAAIWVDGSFVTQKPNPVDADILVVVQADFFNTASSAQKAVLDWVATDLKATFKCHTFIHVEYPVGHPDRMESEWFHAYWLRQFGFNRKDDPKGLAVIRNP